MVHLTRATLRYTAPKDWQKITPALRAIYTASTVDGAASRFDDFVDVAECSTDARMLRSLWTVGLQFPGHTQ